MDGLLLVDKPEGWTSFDVVAKVRGLIRQQTGVKKPKVGHTGTLDPLATGLLVLTIGSYCKRASEFSKLDKVYEVTMRLGQTSTTGDDEGEKTAVSDDRPSLEAVQAAIKSFVGQIEQVPPAYSAIKVDGQRAYKLARTGKEVKLEPRKVTIYSLESIIYDYPYLSFETKVSSGTYIRALAQDIGQALNTGAYLSALRRLKVGEFRITDAALVQDLDAEVIYRNLLSFE